MITVETSATSNRTWKLSNTLVHKETEIADILSLTFALHSSSVFGLRVTHDATSICKTKSPQAITIFLMLLKHDLKMRYT